MVPDGVGVCYSLCPGSIAWMITTFNPSSNPGAAGGFTADGVHNGLLQALEDMWRLVHEVGKAQSKL